MRRPSTTRFLATIAATALLLTACGGDDEEPDATDAPTDDGAADDGGPGAAELDGPPIVVRGQDFSESATIAEVYGQYLDALGYDIQIEDPAGFRVEAVDGIRNGELGLIIDYIGGSQTELAPDAEPSSDPDEVMATIEPLYEEIGGTVLEHSPAVDGDALVARGDMEAETISELADMEVVFGAAAHCFERPQCYLGLTDPDVYGIEFTDTVTIEFGPLLGEALSAEEVDVVIWNTTAPQIEEEGFKILEDDQGLFPAQNIAPIVLTEVLEAYGDQLAEDINALSAMITTDDLLEWNRQTDIEFREPDDVATEWLEDNDLL